MSEDSELKMELQAILRQGGPVQISVSKDLPRTKKEFMIQYVLNRSLSLGENGLSGDGAAKEAGKAWDEINRHD